MTEPKFNIPWMRWRVPFVGISIAFVIISIIDIAWNGLTLGLDFTGGTLVETRFEEPADPEVVRRTLEDAGFADGVVQLFGSERDVLVRMPPQAEGDQAKLGDAIVATLRDAFGEVTLVQSNFVGPVVGEQLRDEALAEDVVQETLLAALSGGGFLAAAEAQGADPARAAAPLRLAKPWGVIVTVSLINRVTITPLLGSEKTTSGATPAFAASTAATASFLRSI